MGVQDRGSEMSNLTQKAIKDTFLELLDEKPLNQITVKELVGRCGINRNSFYYHFQDIPALLGELVKELFDTLIGKYPNITSISECFGELFAFAGQHRRAMLHVWNSLNRDILERDLMRFCEYVVSSYLETAFPQEIAISEKDRGLIIHFLKCQFFGECIYWMSNGMPEDAIEEVKRMLAVCHGLPEDIISRCQAIEKREGSKIV